MSHVRDKGLGGPEVSYLFEYKAVPEGMSIDAGGFEPFEFGLDCTSEKGPLEAGSVSGLHDRLIDFVQQPGDRGKEVRLQDPQILDDSKGGARVVADAPPASQDDEVCASLRFNHIVSMGGLSKTSDPLPTP